MGRRCILFTEVKPKRSPGHDRFHQRELLAHRLHPSASCVFGRKMHKQALQLSTTQKHGPRSQHWQKIIIINIRKSKHNTMVQSLDYKQNVQTQMSLSFTSCSCFPYRFSLFTYLDWLICNIAFELTLSS
jgi:sulfite reductase beta subunit-like hemoprotein